jgi:hypothetical protein
MSSDTNKPDIPRSDAIRGTTMRWSWTEGPTKGKTHEHVFHGDGTVEWREVGGSGETGERPVYGAFEVGPQMYAVSYLAPSGFTLTVVANLGSGELVGFASNNDSWFPLRGICERVR